MADAKQRALVSNLCILSDLIDKCVLHFCYCVVAFCQNCSTFRFAWIELLHFAYSNRWHHNWHATDVWSNRCGNYYYVQSFKFWILIFNKFKLIFRLVHHSLFIPSAYFKNYVKLMFYSGFFNRNIQLLPLSVPYLTAWIRWNFCCLYVVWKLQYLSEKKRTSLPSSENLYFIWSFEFCYYSVHISLWFNDWRKHSVLLVHHFCSADLLLLMKCNEDISLPVVGFVPR